MSKDMYDFDQDINNDGPTIKMGGQEYKLRYPTIEEIEKLQNLKTDEERAEALYGFVEKTKEDQPEFREVLKKQNVKVLVAFSQMIKDEFGVE